MPTPDEALATKADLKDVAQPIESLFATLSQKLNTGMDAVVQSTKDYVDERLRDVVQSLNEYADERSRDMQTELLRGIADIATI